MHVKAKKHLGQNFLTNEDTLNKIIETAEIHPEDTILEIGPGRGVLTEELLKKAKKVISVEMDSDLIPYLRAKFIESRNLELIEADILKLEPPKTPFKVVANIPYYITSPILNHFLQAQEKPSSMTLLVQKEVAEKICGSNEAKKQKHSILSLQVQLFGEPKIMAFVPPSHFKPSPKVDSAILHIEVYKDQRYKNPLEILKLAKVAFSQKRKKLSNTIGKTFDLNDKRAIQTRAHGASAQREEETGSAGSETKRAIQMTRRPETLSIKEWEELNQYINKH